MDQQMADQVPAEAEQVSLNINDLASMKNLIDIVTQRGAFKAAELSSVGMLYDKLNKFLSSIPPQDPMTQPAEETESQGE